MLKNVLKSVGAFFVTFLLLSMVAAAFAQVGPTAILPEEDGPPVESLNMRGYITYGRDMFHQSVANVVLTNLDKRFGQRILINDIRMNYGQCDHPRMVAPKGIERRSVSDIKQHLINNGWHPEEAAIMAQQHYVPSSYTVHRKYIKLGETLAFLAKGNCQVQVVELDVWVHSSGTKTFTFEFR